MFGYVHYYHVSLHIFTYISSPSTTEASTLAFHKSARFSRGGMLSMSEKKPDGVHVQVRVSCLSDWDVDTRQTLIADGDVCCGPRGGVPF